ncbi:hypothetical protein AC249_AIPGENE7624 [Exaiptasia diaphana]|nr:hypothetical protein AC249_AIPGENE7624 [Exaiptasia diaphana]
MCQTLTFLKSQVSLLTKELNFIATFRENVPLNLWTDCPPSRAKIFRKSRQKTKQDNGNNNCTTSAILLHKKIEELALRIVELERELVSLKESYEIQVKNLENQVFKKSFTIERFKDDANMLKFYTGLEDYTIFKSIFDSFGSAVENLIYYDSNTNSERLTSHLQGKRGRKRTLTAEQEFFMVLTRLRCGLLEDDLACRVGISASHVSGICITWHDFLHTRFRSHPIWPTRSIVNETMPQSFKDSYPQTRVIIDCTELFIEMPSSLRSQSKTYSNYKHHNTAKGLVGIAPSGMITFVSDLYSGRTSDKEATRDCGILPLLEEGDSIMVDKGFDIEDILPKNVSLNIPPFLREKDHFSLEEETETRRIAALRIHVERAIRRIKCFRILKMEFPLSMAADLNKIWVICAYLCNLMPPIIAESE